MRSSLTSGIKWHMYNLKIFFLQSSGGVHALDAFWAVPPMERCCGGDRRDSKTLALFTCNRVQEIDTREDYQEPTDQTDCIDKAARVPSSIHYCRCNDGGSRKEHKVDRINTRVIHSMSKCYISRDHWCCLHVGRESIQSLVEIVDLDQNEYETHECKDIRRWLHELIVALCRQTHCNAKRLYRHHGKRPNKRAYRHVNDDFWLPPTRHDFPDHTDGDEDNKHSVGDKSW